ncbi:MAG: cytochrome c biogenesis protein CcsA [Chloroflexota bacterium]|nr:cytochrome c biogenesis protein CcsA [Chloroflexota bacterium]
MVRVIGAAALINIAVALSMALFYAPTERTMGDAQRIFYFHVPSAWVGFLAFFIVFLASLMFLWKRERKWDALALSAAEIGVIFTTLVLLTGPLWAKKAWGAFWVWDARLTTTLILWMIYIGYLMLRNSSEGERRARFAAVLAIVGFLDVPIIYLSVEFWRTQHPSLLITESGGLAPQMTQTLMVALLSFTLLFVFLVIQRVRLEQARDQVNFLREASGG